MGLLGDIVEAVTGADTDEPHEWGHGFDPNVCIGCEYHGEVLRGTTIGCQKCGCPEQSLDASQAPPSSCPRLEDHRR